ncbi:MAG TPA: LuxR C-terminal-related transcriptional regulator [Burkholderiales bacterium]|nr:LuxR C-terminal-related transcriptional regulator [Burkholderiales bacterium]
MSHAVLRAVKASGRLRISIHADDPEVAAELRRVLEEAGHEVVDAAGFAPAPDEPRALLTPREIEVLGAIGEGLTNKAIARRLDISLHTVKFHVESLFRKLGARTRTEALARAAERRVEL